jgi:hypothetical protein
MWEYSELMDFIFPRRGILKKILVGAALCGRLIQGLSCNWTPQEPTEGLPYFFPNSRILFF